MTQTKTFRFEATPEFLSDDVISKFAEEFNSNVVYSDEKDETNDEEYSSRFE